MKTLKVIASISAATLLLAGCRQYEYPFQNPKLGVEERVDNLMSLLTPEEKVGLMMNGSISIDRLGIPAYNWWSEACHGICASDATVFPQAIGLAATFDEPQQLEIYTAVSDEARARWNTTDHNLFGKTEATGGAWHQGLSFWCPNINIFRDPRWGRGQETAGEDPYLSGVMGAATVRAMQGDDPHYVKTHACAKHYAVHSGPESSRHRDDVSVSQRDLWETYLPAFKKLVTEAKVEEVMGAYNRYEGDPCCASDRLLKDILRDKWGFEGFVVSDCGAINNFYTKGQHETHPDAATASAAAIKAGTDLECGTSYNALLEAVEKGLVSQEEIDVCLRRILRARFELGTLDPEEMSPWKNLGEQTISSPEHTALALKAAREAMVLLKNDGILPLSKDLKKIAVIGPNADNVSMHLGNYNGTPTAENTQSIVDAIRQAAPGAEIIYDHGCDLVADNITINLMSSFNGGKGLHGVYYNTPDYSGDAVAEADYNEGFRKHTYGDYRFENGVNGNGFSARYSGSFTADFSGKLYYSIACGSIYRFSINGKTVVEQTEPVKVRLFGNDTPETYIEVEKGKEYNVNIDYSMGNEGIAFLSLDFFHRVVPDYQALSQKIKDADVIIVVGGLSARLEGEEMPVQYDGFSGGDRTRIELPAAQQKLIDTAAKTGKPVVLVNCTGSAIGFGELESKYNALLQAWYAGQATGRAVADILFGDYNPAGRLPITFYASTSQLPDFMDYSMENRTYRYFKGKALYPFGYGLSYTTFAYGDAAVEQAGEELNLTIPVSNTGSLDGEEVVQVYVKSLDDPQAPIKSLKGFKRVAIKAGQTAQVSIRLGSDAFEFYEPSVDGLALRHGNYRILYGSSSRDEDLKAVDMKI